MPRADTLTLQPDDDGDGGIASWALAGAVILAIHGAALVYLQKAPEPVSFDSQVPIELDLLPPSAGEAQLDASGQNAPSVAADAAPEETPEEAPVDDATPPDETIPQDTPDETLSQDVPDEATPAEAPPVAQAEALPDVEPAVPLPPDDAVVAQDEPVEPSKTPTPPVVKRQEPKREIKRVEQAKPKRETVQRDRPTARPAQASEAGGRGGAASSAGASRSAAVAYGARLRAMVAAQQRRAANISGDARVTFVVGRNGNVMSVSASGPPEAAREAQAMVRRASFPPMPAEMTGSRTPPYTMGIGFTAGR